jgi:hypothetical protein
MAMNLPRIDHLLGPNLATYDPYDLWKTKFGLWLRRLYYRNGLLAAPLVAPFFLLDAYAPRVVRAFINPQEYPTVRAMAVMAALNLYETDPDPKFLGLAEISADWLVANQSPGYHGACWGLNFPWMTKGGYCPSTTPFITHTPYCVEALFKCFDATGKAAYYDTAVSALDFLEKDMSILWEDAEKMAMGYGPGYERRIVINANSYAMMLYALFSERIPQDGDALVLKAMRLFNFVVSSQKADGSWFYYHEADKGNFIDCFHSCFVMKNLIKFGKLAGMQVMPIVEKGLNYLYENFVDRDYGLARRFSVSANPSLAKFDLYDQAELLNVLLLLRRMEDAERLLEAVMKYFYLPARRNFGYQIDKFGLFNRMSYLRWAVMPMVLVLSEYGKLVGKDSLVCQSI